MLYLIFAVIGGCLYMLRGGYLNDLIGWGQKTQASRIIAWATPTAFFMVLDRLPWWLFVALVLSNWIALAAIGTGQYLRDVPLKSPDWLGAARNAIAVAPLAWFAPWLAAAYVASGLAHAALYWASYRLFRISRAGDFFVGALSWLVIWSFHV